jgi:hypothetical protein
MKAQVVGLWCGAGVSPAAHFGEGNEPGIQVFSVADRRTAEALGLPIFFASPKPVAQHIVTQIFDKYRTVERHNGTELRD